MAADIGPKIGIQGEAEFRRELGKVNEGIKTLGSEMQVVTSEFLNNENSVEALTAKNDVLGRTVSSLNDRLELQKKMLAEAASEYGEADEKTQKWQQVVNRTQAEINKYTAEIEKNDQAIDDLGKETDKAGGLVNAFGDLLKANLTSEAIIAGVKALGGAITGTVKALGDMVLNAAYAADDLNTMSKTTGLSTAELQKFQYASDMIDVSVDTLTGSMTKLTSNMYSAQSGSGAAAEAFEALGISVTDGSGELRDRNEVFQEAIAALGEMTNETERDATAMKLFGKSAQDLNPLILGGADALQTLGDEAESAGLILSQDDLDALNLVSDAVDRFNATTAAAGNLFMVGFAEPISAVVNQITDYLHQMTAAFTEGGWDALSETFGEVLSDLTGKILEYLPEAVRFGSNIINSLVLGLVDMLPEIVTAAVSIITTLAEGLADLLPELIPAAVDAVVTITEALIDNVDTLIDAALAIILALAEGIIEALPRLIEKAPEIIEKLVTAIYGEFPKIISTGVQLVIELVAGIVKSVATLVSVAPELISALVTAIEADFHAILETGQAIVDTVKAGFMEKVEEAKQWGTDLIQNFIDGIGSMVRKVKETVSNIANTVKDFLGFSEPDKGPLSNFHTYGPDMMKLYARGIADNAWRVQDALESATAGMVPILPESPSAAAQAGATASGTSPAAQFGEIVLNLTSEIDGAVLARKQYRYNLAELNRHGSSLVGNGGYA